MDPEEAADLLTVARIVGSTLEKHYNATSLNFGIQDGLEAGQSGIIIIIIINSTINLNFNLVQHVHLHILPRRKGDFKKDEVYDRLENHDKDPNAKRRSQDEMKAEANILRSLFYN
jgi:diadenosine tetraphosphate (Ap4A) HIT family hydrolase